MNLFLSSKGWKAQKDKIILPSFCKFVRFYHFSVPEERISEIFFEILLTKVLTDNKKVAYLI